VEILKYVVKLDSVVAPGNAWEAALIVSDNEPGISDAVEILKWVVRLENVLDATHPRV
jgi:hypothetical protein